MKQQAQARLQQEVEELSAAAVRALAGETDLHFRSRRLHRGTRPLPLFAPHLHPDLERDDRASFRGAADGLALRLLCSDAALHARLAPAEPVQRLVFDMLEQFRVESMALPSMPGVAHNLRHRFEAWSLGFHHAGHTEGARGLLLYTVFQVCRAQVVGEPAIEETEDMMEATRAGIGPRIGHALAALKRTRADQAAYATHALVLAQSVADLIDAADPTGTADADASTDAEPEDDERRAYALVMEAAPELAEQAAAAVAGRSRVLDADAGAYRVYTTAYDREVEARSAMRAERLLEYRTRLDRRIAGQGVNLPRLARTLRALLAEPTEDGWDGALEEGRIDGRRLASLIASPAERRLFRAERIEPRPDAVVSFLIDCSGSMKEHIESLAMLVDVLVRALEQAGVASEVLGYTTGAWHGGRAARDWRRAGSPAHPGRLNERLHLVFKDAATPWRRARGDLAALLHAEQFREGLDGEAVDWAASRLAARDERRKLLLAISDGSPMDGATNLANDAHYLDHHLRDVVTRHEQAGVVQLHGVGVGLDLSPYYTRSHVLDFDAAAGNRVFGEVVAMLAGHRVR
ncbi:MAG: cobalt chelatase [Proteobacteria bacterium]|nr:cobalt chelatase [Pseudomonadota bacterium]